MDTALKDILMGVADSFTRLAPAMLAAIIIGLIGWIVAIGVKKGAPRLFRALRLDAATKRAGIKFPVADWIGTAMYYGVLLITAQLAFGAFGPNPVSELIEKGVLLIPRLIVAVIILIVASAAAAAVADMVGRATEHTQYQALAARAARYGVLGMGGIAALSHVGVGMAVTQPVLIAILSAVVGVVVVGVGGGLIGPARAMWERQLGRVVGDSSASGDGLDSHNS